MFRDRGLPERNTRVKPTITNAIVGSSHAGKTKGIEPNTIRESTNSFIAMKSVINKLGDIIKLCACNQAVSSSSSNGIAGNRLELYWEAKTLQGEKELLGENIPGAMCESL